MADQAQTGQPANQHDAAAATDTSTPAVAAKPLSGPTLLVGLLIMLLTPTAGYLLTTLAMPNRSATLLAELQQEAQHRAAKQQKEHEAGMVTFPLAAMHVNILDTRGTRMLKILPHLQLSEPQMASKLPSLKALLLDTIATVASSKTLDELDGPAGRENLKKAIVLRLNQALAPRLSGTIVDLYFEEFLLE